MYLCCAVCAGAVQYDRSAFLRPELKVSLLLNSPLESTMMMMMMMMMMYLLFVITYDADCWCLSSTIEQCTANIFMKTLKSQKDVSSFDGFGKLDLLSAFEINGFLHRCWLQKVEKNRNYPPFQLQSVQ